MRKHNILFALVTVTALSMCGCGNVDGVISSVNSSVTAEQASPPMSEITESSSDLSGISAPDTGTENDNSRFPGKCKIYTATTVRFTDEQLFDFFNAHPECGAVRCGNRSIIPMIITDMRQTTVTVLRAAEITFISARKRGISTTMFIIILLNSAAINI